MNDTALKTACALLGIKVVKSGKRFTALLQVDAHLWVDVCKGCHTKRAAMELAIRRIREDAAKPQRSVS